MSAPSGKVISIHLHPAKSGAPLASVKAACAEATRGLVGDRRFFGRVRRNGAPSRRQVSLINREQILRHAETLGLAEIPAGIVRANIETEGIDLVSLLGRQVKIGAAVLFFYEPRTPCWKMDLIAPGLRSLMENAAQGVMAEVVASGEIRVGDAIEPLGQLSSTLS